MTASSLSTQNPKYFMKPDKHPLGLINLYGMLTTYRSLCQRSKPESWPSRDFKSLTGKNKMLSQNPLTSRGWWTPWETLDLWANKLKICAVQLSSLSTGYNFVLFFCLQNMPAFFQHELKASTNPLFGVWSNLFSFCFPLNIISLPENYIVLHNLIQIQTYMMFSMYPMIFHLFYS